MSGTQLAFDVEPATPTGHFLPPDQPLHAVVHPSWAQALAPVEADLRALDAQLFAEAEAGCPYLPTPPNVLRAFAQPLDEVRVLVVGQDPYPTPGHAMGLSFSVAAGVTPPRSLSNIFTELEADLGAQRPSSGDLSPWVAQGVLLLNRVLTVAPGEAGSHQGWGWEAVTEAAIRALVERDGPLVAILWGKQAERLRPLLGDTPVIASAHPSPLSARRGFFGSRPFSRTNTLLARQDAVEIDWQLP